MRDFLQSEHTLDGYSEKCRGCAEEQDYINNNESLNLKKQSKMATLKEKREAAAAEAAANAAKGVTETPAAETAAAPAEKAPKEEKAPAAPKPAKVEKKIEKCNLVDGEYVVVETFDTAEQAAKALETTRAYVMDNLKGWTKTVRGFRLRYEGEAFFVREPKAKVEGATPAPKAEKASKVEDKPVPGDLDYDEELHGEKPVVKEEDLDEPESEETAE